MMVDLVEQLRASHVGPDPDFDEGNTQALLVEAAADEIERKEAEIERLRAALQAVVDAYPVASGIAYGEDGYGAIGAARRLLDMSVCGESSQQSPQDVRKNERRRT